MGLNHRKWSHPASHVTSLFKIFTTSGCFYRRIEVEMQRRRPRPCSCLPRSSQCLFLHTSEVAYEHFLSLLFPLSPLTRGRFDSSLCLCLSWSWSWSWSWSVWRENKMRPLHTAHQCMMSVPPQRDNMMLPTQLRADADCQYRPCGKTTLHQQRCPYRT